jgi:cold shock protein
MATGTVKKLVGDRGFGFITAQDGSELFFHRSAVQGVAFDSLTAGQDVEFDVEHGAKGPRAANVRLAAAGA